MSSIFAWNMRGFNKPRKQRAVRQWLQAAKLSFGCLLETKVQRENFQGIFDATFPGWNCLHNYDYHPLGRIWVCWTNDVEIVPAMSSAQMITCWVRIRSTGVVLLASFVYASNHATERKILWREMEMVASSMVGTSYPWIVQGDFNVILTTNEHSRGANMGGETYAMREFQDVVRRCGLDDLAQVGSLFTWTNRQPDTPISKKLDRVLVNGQWLSSFPVSFATFEAGGVSDHLRFWTQLQPPEPTNRKPFKFFTHVTTHPRFLEVVANIWNSQEPLYHSRTALKRFHSKLKSLKSALRQMNRDQFGDLPTRVKSAYDELCRKQAEATDSPSQEAFEDVSTAWEHWHHISGIEEQFYFQKSRIQWMGLGDRNNCFYHNVCKARNSKNAIRRIIATDGRILTDLNDIKAEAVSHFDTFMNDQPSNLVDVTSEYLEGLIDYRCPQGVAAELIRPVQGEEIKKILFSMPTNKAPGPDGYPVEFYKAAWPVVGKDVIVAVQSFFLFGLLPRSTNATLLSLIPKMTEAERMTDYRPIACCNVVYKVISKIIARRLKATLPPAIELNQCAFIKGRLLLENVLLATELVKDYHKPGISSRSAVKLDISKAFDTVQWSFIETVLRVMGYPALFVTWIMRCVDTAAFSVSVNGDLEGFFSSSRGIRQGCSLSPYLFVIVSNVLSKLLNSAVLNRRIGYHPLCESLKLTHLSFADDIMVFTNGTPTSLEGVLEVFEEYANVSGLRINVAKSTVFAAGIDKQRLQDRAISAGFTISELPIKYLGLPLTTKTMTRNDYEPLLSKIKGRFQSWTSKTLSFAGRLMLIKSVIASTTNFWCSAFCLPKACMEDIDSLCSAFLWSGSPNDSSKAKVSWTEVCKPFKEGGLGIRSIADVSKVFSLKLIWRLLSESHSLWVDWMKKYILRNESFWDVRDTGLGSWVWRKLLKLRHLAKEFVHIEVHNGQTARFWTDLWHPRGRLIEIAGETGTQKLGIDRAALISDVRTAEGVWRFRRCRDRQMREIINMIENHQMEVNHQAPDVVMWRKNETEYCRQFFTAETWQRIRTHDGLKEWSKVVWFQLGVPRFAFITWLAIRNRLSTGERTGAWGQPQGCLFCGEPNETRDHLFFACPYTYTLWLEVVGTLLGRPPDPDWESTLELLTTHSYGRLEYLLVRLVFQAAIYIIWRERNDRKHMKKPKLPSQLARIVDKTVRNRITSTGYVTKPRLRGLMQVWFLAHT
ncbi:uncharacterized protein LOC103844146 [Brassica rapa]|uniref:uncharacterized protein LOC103844146 n=1 Tax=Brassica campestris TaxID=3711 RepID=UPI00142DC8D1|nr:uncharacterized protein LOC103844146 [Brassica rapa]